MRQRKAWLREALTDVARGQLDEVEQMKQCLAVLHREGKGEGEEDGDEDDDVEEKESALEMLSELCENLDNARGL